MTLFTAATTAHPVAVGLLLTAAAVLAGLVYVGHCVFRPYAACRRCDGDGKFRSPSGRSWRKCRRCRGSGERLRLGRRLWNWGRNKYRSVP